MNHETEKPLPVEVKQLFEKKLQIIQQIKELKAKSAEVSLQLAKTGNRNLEILGVIPCW